MKKNTINKKRNVNPKTKFQIVESVFESEIDNAKKQNDLSFDRYFDIFATIARDCGIGRIHITQEK